jgi:hypothetical protein
MSSNGCRQENVQDVAAPYVPHLALKTKGEKENNDCRYESGVRSIIKLRKEDLSAMKSIHPVQRGKEMAMSVGDVPLLDLYSMIVEGGRCSTGISQLFLRTLCRPTFNRGDNVNG